MRRSTRPVTSKRPESVLAMPSPPQSPSPTAMGTPVASPAAAPESTPPAPPAAAPAGAPLPRSDADVAPAPGFLLVVVSPWADVAIDGQPAGQTPLGRIRLPPGAHTVRLSHPAFQPYPRKVMVRSGETTRITVDLAQDGIRIGR